MQWVTRGEGGRFRFRARDGKSMAAVIRSKSQQSAARVCTPRRSHACLQELLKRLQDRHVECAQALTKKAAADAQAAATVNPDTPNVLQAMMKLEQAKARAKTANKVALELWRRRRKRMLLKKQWKN